MSIDQATAEDVMQEQASELEEYGLALEDLPDIKVEDEQRGVHDYIRPLAEYDPSAETIILHDAALDAQSRMKVLEDFYLHDEVRKSGASVVKSAVAELADADSIMDAGKTLASMGSDLRELSYEQLLANAVGHELVHSYFDQQYRSGLTRVVGSWRGTAMRDIEEAAAWFYMGVQSDLVEDGITDKAWQKVTRLNFSLGYAQHNDPEQIREYFTDGIAAYNDADGEQAERAAAAFDYFDEAYRASLGLEDGWRSRIVSFIE